MTPDLSIIIPVYDRASELAICLAGLRSHLNGLRSEVIIIDDASPNDGAQEVFSRYGGSYFRNNQRRGSAYCKNIGIDRSSANILLFLDSDIEFLKSTSLSAMMTLLTSTPLCGQVGGEALLAPSGQLSHIFGRNIDIQTGRSRCDYFDVSRYSSPVRYDYIPTSNCMVKRSDAVKINGFDDYYPPLGEDKDFGYRLACLGLRSYVMPKGVVFHQFAQTGRRGSQLDKQYRTQVRFCLRHYGFRAATISLLYQELRLAKPRETQPVHRDPIIESFERRYVREILKIQPGETGWARRTLTGMVRVFRAVLWNFCHPRGLRREGSELLSLKRGSHTTAD